jgi:hypothetical protein
MDTRPAGTSVPWRPILATGIVIGAAGGAAVALGTRWVMRSIEEGFAIDLDDGIWHTGDDYGDDYEDIEEFEGIEEFGGDAFVAVFTE